MKLRSGSAKPACHLRKTPCNQGHGSGSDSPAARTSRRPAARLWPRTRMQAPRPPPPHASWFWLWLRLWLGAWTAIGEMLVMQGSTPSHAASCRQYGRGINLIGHAEDLRNSRDGNAVRAPRHSRHL